MKRYLFIISCIATIISCTKENSINTENVENAFSGAVEAFDVVNATKTQLEGSTIAWSIEDNIVIFDATANTRGKYQTTTAGTSTNFSFVEGGSAADGPYYACYPYESCSSIGAGNFIIEFASNQSYTSNSFSAGSFPMVAYSTTKNLKFMNVGGLMLIQLKTNNLAIKVTKIEIAADQDLCGTVKVNYDGVSAPSIQGISNGTKKLTVNFDSPITINSTATPIFVSVPGKVYTNVTVKVITENGVEQTLKASNVEIIRSKKTTMNVAANRLFTDIALLNSTQSGYSSRQNGNCYIVNSAGSYKIPLLEGTTTSALDVDEVSIEWQKNDIIENVSLSLDGKYLEFNTKASIPQGNALVAAKKAGKIVWSWHIWSSSFRLGTDDVNYNGKYWMDRNIGGYIPVSVTINEKPSTYYKSDIYFAFNRKDPIRPQSPVLEIVDYLTALQNPTILYSNKENQSWTSEHEKFSWTKENPCPIGYEIPTSGFPVIGGPERIGGGMCWMQDKSHLDAYNGYGYYYDNATMYWVNSNSTTRGLRLTRDNTIEDASRAAYMPIRCVKKNDIK